MKKPSYGNISIRLIFTDLADIRYLVTGDKKPVSRSNLYDALSDYGVDYEAAKKIVRLYLRTEFPVFKTYLYESDFKSE